MGSSVSRVVGCFVPQGEHDHFAKPLDEGLGHSFYYSRPTLGSTASSPTRDYSWDHSLFNSSSLLGDSDAVIDEDQVNKTKIFDKSKNISETSFKSISGASVSANSSTPRSILSLELFNSFANIPTDRAAAFESTPSFTSIPLQPAPRGTTHSGPISGSFSGTFSGPLERGFMSGPLERSFMSGPLERNYLSAPLERGFMSGPLEKGAGIMSGPLDRAFLSGPLDQHQQESVAVHSGSVRKRRKSFTEYVNDASVPMRRALLRTQKSMKNLVRHRRSTEGNSGDFPADMCSVSSEFENERHNLQWAQGKAGEDRVHIVLSEEHGWMFVGIYDGFSGPDAPDFLMSNLYPAIYKELQGLLWDQKEAFGLSESTEIVGRNSVTKEDDDTSTSGNVSLGVELDRKLLEDRTQEQSSEQQHIHLQQKAKLRTSLGVRLKHAYRRRKKGNHKNLFQWRYDWEQERNEYPEIKDLLDGNDDNKCSRRGPVDHAAVLNALARALEVTEKAYLEMSNREVMENPELALVGSCLLVMLMKDEEVYIMNLGDSRAVLAQDTKPQDHCRCSKGQTSNQSDESERIDARDSMLKLELERIIEETPTELAAMEAAYDVGELAPPPVSPTLVALQLSSDHSTSIEEEVTKIKQEHPDDSGSIANDRVKGRLKVTRAFGAGFLKQPQLNEALLEVFRVDFIGTTPYLSCAPHLQHHRLCPRDQFLVLSSDGLYQYLSNEEVVAHVEWFIEKFPDGDPAQYLIEQLLFRAAKKAGMDFHELLDIPQGDRRRYHDDVSVMVISLEGRIWRSSS